MDIQAQVKEIKQSFRQMMDGAVAQSMRNKGVDYKLNWGATLPRLREKADEIGKNYDLSIALWKEDVRECKILATMVMPADVVLPEVIDIWNRKLPNRQPSTSSSICLMPPRRPIHGWLPTRNSTNFVASIYSVVCL